MITYSVTSYDIVLFINSLHFKYVNFVAATPEVLLV